MRNLPVLLVVFSVFSTAGASEPMLLWPKGAPGEKGDIGAEQDMTKPIDGLVDGRAKVPSEKHLFAKGGHGYGLRETGQAAISWPKRAEEWMRGLGVLDGKEQ